MDATSQGRWADRKRPLVACVFLALVYSACESSPAVPFDGLRKDADAAGTDTEIQPDVAPEVAPDVVPSDTDTPDAEDGHAGVDVVSPTTECAPDAPACSNCIDDDGDGLADANDPHCLSALDDDEASFKHFAADHTGPGGNIDCFFDADIGGNADGCRISLECLEEGGADCEPSAMCVERCLPLTPPGCDCFGCCTMCVGADCRTVQLHPSVSPTCTLDALDDPDHCPACTPDAACMRPCGDDPCALCPGQLVSDLPPQCAGVNVCSAGLEACTSDADCSPEAPSCQVGCCVASRLAVVRGPVIADFEDNGPLNRWGGPITTDLDLFGSTMTPDPWAAGAAAPSPAGNDSDYAACFDGVLAPHDPLAGVFTAAELQLHLDAGGAAADIQGWADDGGLSIRFRSAVPGVAYRVNLMTFDVLDFGYYSVLFRPLDDGWHTWDFYFPGADAEHVFSQPYWADAAPFDPSNAYGIFITPVANDTATAYDFCLDDVTLAVPPPTPRVPVLADFEAIDYTTTNRWGGLTQTWIDNFGTTMSPHPWAPGSGAVPPEGADSARAACFSGVLASHLNATAHLQLFFQPDASAIDLSAYLDGGGISLNLHTSTPGVTYEVVLATADQEPDEHYRALLKTKRVGWETHEIYPPGVETDKVLAQPAHLVSQVPFDPTRVVAVYIGPVPRVSEPTPFDFCVDDVSLVVPEAPPARHVLADFESSDYYPENDRGGAIETSVDFQGSVLTPHPWSPGAGTVPPEGNDSALAACLTGQLAAIDMPKAAITLHFNQDASGTDITEFGVDPGVQFKLWSSTLGTSYRVQLLVHHRQHPLEYRSRVSHEGWHTVNVYYPDVATDRRFDAPFFAPEVPFQPADVYALRFEPMPSPPGAETDFELCIDDILFATPQAPAGGLRGPPLVTDFEDDEPVTAWPGGDISLAVDDIGSTTVPAAWLAGSATFPGAYGDSVLAGCVDGIIVGQDSANDVKAQVRLTMGLAAEGSQVDVTPIATEGALEFDFKGRPGNVYSIRLATAGIEDGGYYQFEFVPKSLDWAHYTVWFVGSGPAGDGSDELSQPAWAEPAPWAPHQARFVDAGPVPLEGQEQLVDFCIDNVTFR